MATPTTALATIAVIMKGWDSCDNNNQMGMAATDPRVPGALGDNPLPKPKANNKTGERSS
jgi:hypothetical protein